MAFLSAGSTAGYVFLYSVYYFLCKTKMSGLLQTSFYFGYTCVPWWLQFPYPALHVFSLVLRKEEPCRLADLHAYTLSCCSFFSINLTAPPSTTTQPTT